MPYHDMANQDILRAQLAQSGNPAAMNMPPPVQAGQLPPPQAGAPRPGPVGMDLMMPDNPEDFRKMFKQLSKEEQAKMLAGMVADYEGRSAGIASGEDYAAGLRDDRELGTMSAGGMQVARSPFEHLSKTGNNLLSGYGAKRGRDARGALSGQSEGTLGALMAAALRGGGGGYRPPGYGNIGT